jgi:pSer/pThr/pTyr-binding forkhead associated (FHA) protein
MAVTLILVRGDGRQSEIPLKGRAIIGRQTDCQIRIPSSGISRHHCELTLADGKVLLRDMGSSNGTFVNRKKIQQAQLAAGDLIGIGDLVFAVRIDGNPATIDSEDALDEGSAPAVTTPAKPAAAAKAPQAKQAGGPGAPQKGLLDADPSHDSSVADFDFLDEDDDIKKQPKL